MKVWSRSWVASFAVAMGSLALANFDRAKTLADGIHLVDIRIQVYLMMAEQTIRPSQERPE